MKSSNKKQTEIHDKKRQKTLHDFVEQTLNDYFEDLDGHKTSDLYMTFMCEIETPFFKTVMQHTRGNITHAAKLLGLNRATLKKRLKKYNLH